jgi:hypothetical protein
MDCKNCGLLVYEVSCGAAYQQNVAVHTFVFGRASEVFDKVGVIYCN